MYTFNEVQYEGILHIKELYIPSNKVTCIIGESGSGKSTLIRLLNNLNSCDSGEIYFHDKLIDSIDPIQLRRKVVMVPQVPIIFEGTVKDNLLIGLKFSEKDMVTDTELEKILTIVHLEKQLKENADQLSGGEKQRLCLARALVMDADVYLLDEPSSSLDENTEEKVIGNMVREIKQKERTLIMVTHSNKVANTYGDILVQLKNGNIIGVKEVS